METSKRQTRNSLKRIATEAINSTDIQIKMVLENLFSKKKKRQGQKLTLQTQEQKIVAD